MTSALKCEVLLWDMDGVLAEVAGSYRAAIVQTASHFGVTVTNQDIAAEKQKGNANNDWVLTQGMVTKGLRLARACLFHCFAECCADNIAGRVRFFGGCD